MKNEHDDAFQTRATAPMSTLDDPIATFAAFHQLIRKQCVNLDTLARDLIRFRADNVARHRCAMMVRFFDVDAREHHADEELIFFPRLLALDIDATAKAELAALLDVLSRDHCALDKLWQALRRSLLSIIDGNLDWANADVTTFVTLHHHHIHKEESSIFPFARRYFCAEALQELRCAIIARRSEIQP